MKWILENKKIAAGVVTAGLILGIWYVNTRHYVPKNSEEFFKRNPHLQRPISRLPLEADQLRADDKFREGDYQLLPGTVYPVEFNDVADFTQADQAPQHFETSGKVLLKSLGLMKGRLVILAEFEYARIKEMKKLPATALEEIGILKTPNQKPTKEQMLKRTLLVKLDPRGMVKEIYTHSPKVSRASLESRLKLLDQIFKRLPIQKPGTLAVTEIDEQGYPYRMNYQIVDQGTILEIKAASGQDYGLNDTESKAAAVGAQGMGMFGLKGKQAASMSVKWIKSEQRPQEQISEGQSELRARNQLIAQMSGKSKVTWKEKTTASDLESMAKPFTHLINVQLLRSVIRSQQKKALDQKTQAKTKTAKPEKLTAAQKHDQAFQKMTDDIKNNPQKIDTFKSMAMGSEAGSQGLSMALGALGYEGSEDSQKALVEVYGRTDLGDRDRSKIMTELTLAEFALAPEVKKFLRQEFEKGDYSKSKIAKQAGLALGSSIAKDGDPETIQYFHDKWDEVGSLSENAGDERGRQNYLLKVMGNSKSDVFESEAKSVASSSDPMLRAAAADSVRFSQSQSTRDLLFGLLSDKDPEVRTLVVQALRYQPFDQRTSTALQNCTSDQDVGVRVNCYRMLSHNINQPGIREFISSRAGSESDPQVSRTLSEALTMENNARK